MQNDFDQKINKIASFSRKNGHFRAFLVKNERLTVKKHKIKREQILFCSQGFVHEKL